MIDVAKLIACGVGPKQAKVFAPHLVAACERFEIRAVSTVAAFIAQAMHESTNFTRLEEGLYYSTPENIHRAFARLRGVPLGVLAAGYTKKPQALANLAYANVNGNGDESSGDGWKFRGRGCFQITGRANYLAAAAASGRPYKDQPELVAQPLDAAMTAGWFWSSARLNSIMERGGIDAVSKRINGGTNGLVERREIYQRCVKALL
jgi:putative chitinase